MKIRISTQLSVAQSSYKCWTVLIITGNFIPYAMLLANQSQSIFAEGKIVKELPDFVQLFMRGGRSQSRNDIILLLHICWEVIHISKYLICTKFTKLSVWLLSICSSSIDCWLL